jgi:hypothetical protein
VATLSSGTAALNAKEIAATSFTGYNTYQNGDTVLFVATAVGTQTGTFSYSSDGDSAGTLAATIEGVAVTDSWVYQAAWNMDTCDGNGPSGFTLNPQKGNVYQIKFQYLGYGEILFGIETPGNGEFLPVHRIQYSNANESPSVLQPSLKIGWFAASLGSTGTDMQMFGASAGGFIEGKRGVFRNPDSHSNTKTGVGTTSTNILSLRNRALLNGFLNADELLPLIVTAAADGGKPAVVDIFINATVSGTPNWSYHDEDNSIVEVDTSGTTVAENSSTQHIGSIALARLGNGTLNLDELDVHMTRGDVVTVAAKATASTTDVSASISWRED